MTPVPATSDFLASYPELAGADPTLLNAKLGEAAARTNANVYASDSIRDQAVMLRAAVLLYLSPFARKMRADAPDQVVVWEKQLRALQRSATIGLRVF